MFKATEWRLIEEHDKLTEADGFVSLAKTNPTFDQTNTKKP